MQAEGASAAATLLANACTASQPGLAVWKRLAELSEEVGARDQAWAAHRRLIDMAPDQVDVCQAVFAFCVRTGLLRDGAEMLRPIVAAHPAWPVQRTMYANLLRATGRADEATEEFRAVAGLADRGLDQRSDGDLLHIGAACVEIGRLRDAVAVLQLAVDRAPTASSHHFWLGRAMIATGDLQPGRGHVARAIELAPQDPDIALWYADYCLGESMPAARAAVDHLLELRPELAGRRVQLIKQLQVGGDLVSLRDQQTKLAAIAEGDAWKAFPAEEQLYLGAACLDVGRGDLARPVLVDLVAAVPQPPHHHLWLARAYRATDEPDLGLTELLEAQRLGPDDPTIAAETAGALQDAGRADEAVAVLDEFLELRPEDMARRTQLYDLLVRLGRASELSEQQDIIADRAMRADWQQIPADQLLFVGASCVETGRASSAIPVLEEVVRQYPGVPAHHLWLAKAYELGGRPWPALRALWQAIRLGPVEPDAARECRERYEQLRRALVSQSVSDLAAVGPAADAPAALPDLVVNCLWLCASDSQLPGRRELLIAVAGFLCRDADSDDAAELYLEALSSGPDRSLAQTACLLRNQELLDEFARPMPDALAREALAGLDACVRAGTAGQPLEGARLSAVCRGWTSALRASWTPEPGAGAEAWMGLAAAVPEEPWHTICLLEAAQSRLRDGECSGALLALDQLAAGHPALPATDARARLLRAEATAGQGRLVEAADLLASLLGAASLAPSTPQAGLSSSASTAAREHVAEITESRGNLEQAAVEYREAEAASPDLWQQRRCNYASVRLTELRGLASAFGSTVVPLPDDRSTRGNWYEGYGAAWHALCAQNGIADRMGGLSPPGLEFATTDASEPGRLWVSSLNDLDPAALWDPERRSRVAANRDDYGEHYPPGKGPDLVLQVEVPDGPHILSCYFVNDHSFYEPDRRYTLSVTDAEGRLLAIVPVAGFGAGLYKRFVVRGPLEATLRIWRNTSENTLLSGVFLDQVPVPRPLPYPVDYLPSAALAETFADWRKLCQAYQTTPFGACADSGGLEHLIAAWERVLVSDSPAERASAALSDADTAAGWWTLSECYRIAGRSSSSASAFGRYLEALRPLALSDEPQAYETVARALASSQGARARSVRPPGGQGQHSYALADRAWEAHVAAVVERPTAVPKARGEALKAVVLEPDETASPYAKLRAFELLSSGPTPAPDDPRVCAAAAAAAKAIGEDSVALLLYARALGADPAPADRPVVLAEYLRLQVATDVALSDTSSTLAALMEYAADRRFASLARAGLFDVARAQARAGQREAALSLISRYEQTFGSDESISLLAEQCSTL